LITFTINDNCNGCGVCRIGCPENAIVGKKKKPHVIDTNNCIKCGVCRNVCKFDAVDVE
jgi:Pyruvate/2-oxoacid:ferredoxin oxidoreductase delta subunit